MRYFIPSLLMLCMFLIGDVSYCQSVSISNTASVPDASAMLDISSPNKGVLIPRMNKSIRNGISNPGTGLLVFQNAPDSLGFYYFDGSKWNWLIAGSLDSSSWKLNGNSNALSANFVGTLNDSALHFRIRNVPSGFIDSIHENTAFGYKSGFYNTGSGNTAFGYQSLDSNTTGTYNTAIGHRALKGNKSGTDNTVLGNDAMINNTTGAKNTAIGAIALYSNTSGSNNVAVGNYALNNDSTGSNNTAVGIFSLISLRKGNYNVAVGNSASNYADSANLTISIGANAGFYNKRDAITAIGSSALAYNSYNSNSLNEGLENTGVGYGALFNNTTGNKNTALGFRALKGSFATGYSRNTAVGDSALAVNNGSANTAIGSSALSRNDFGSYIVAIGDSAMALSTGTGANEALGYNALKTLKGGTSYNNTALGGQAMEYDSISYGSVAVGFRALRYSGRSSETTAIGVGAMEQGDSSFENTAVGRAAMAYYGYSHQNVAVGNHALGSIRSGGYNVAVGTYSMLNDTSGLNNTAIGFYALGLNKSGSANIAVGNGAGLYALKSYNTYVGSNTGLGERYPSGNYAADSGYQNTGLGAYALQRIANGFNNVAIGYAALVNDSSGYNNTSLGYNSSYQNITGYFNSAVGQYSLYSNVSGTQNTAIGSGADVLSGNLINATAIGAGAKVGISNGLVLGDNNAYVGIGTSAPTISARLHVSNLGTGRANAGYFETDNNAPVSSNGAAILGINLNNSGTQVSGVMGKAISTPSGYGYGGYFQGNNSGLYAYSNPGFTSFTTNGVYGSAVGATGNTNIGINGFATSGSTNYGVFGQGATLAGYFSGSVYTTGTYNTSDEWLKTNVNDMNTSALEKVLMLKPKTYSFAVNKYKQMNLPEGTQIGFIAQDMEKVFPGLVKTLYQPEEYDHTPGNENIKLQDGVTFKALNYTGLIPVLTKAIQEQQDIINKQQKNIDELMKRVASLEKNMGEGK